MRKSLPLLLLLPAAALAHEFWLQPASYHVTVGAAVPVRLLVGENFAGTSWARPTRRVRRFVRFGPTPLDSADLRPALLADSLAPALRCPAPGTHVVALTSHLAYIELPAAQFTAYLREEGLSLALRQRQEADESTTKPGREAYHRCAKALLLATRGAALPPAAADTGYRRVLGLPLELVPEQNPYRLRPGAALTVRVLSQGRPVPSAQVQVWHPTPLTGPHRTPTPGPPTVTRFATYSNAQGRVLLRLPDAGPYLLTTVRMEAAPAALASRADWLSTWASLTFGGPKTVAAP
ncbi:hypothetical protein A0257_07520 [Hymenobacter psoromatis]|nr:hypothetical protein A0257_07520 [Hymenobacter psoromatis]